MRSPSASSPEVHELPCNNNEIDNTEGVSSFLGPELKRKLRVVGKALNFH
jgi:hypothetical protein